MSWNPEITEVFICAVLSVVGRSVRRALDRLDEQSARIGTIELALARDYVRNNHLLDMQREQRRTNRMLVHIQLQLVALASRFAVRIEPFSGEFTEESNAAAI